MIIRRLVVSLLLVLFASVTIGVIVGLDDAARSDLVSRLPTHNVEATPAESSTPSPAPSATRARASARPQPTPSVTVPATPRAFPSRTPTPTAMPRSTAKATTKPAPKPSATTTPEASTKPVTPAKPTTGASTPTAKGSSKYLKGPLKKGKGGTVYLTFDDGPGVATPQILAILSRTRSTATFFHLGVNEPGFLHADDRIRAQGSKVANHTYNHPDLTTLSASQLRWQINHGPKAKCFRPPYGATDNAVHKAVARAGMREVLWSVDTLDWTKPGTATLAKSGRLKSITNGSIVLMHDGGGDRSQTVAALPTIIADLHARGYKVRALPYC